MNLGMNDMLSTRPNCRTMTSAVSNTKQLEQQRAPQAVAQVSQHVDGDEDRGDQPGGDVEEERGVGVVGGEDDQHRRAQQSEADLGDIDGLEAIRAG